MMRMSTKGHHAVRIVVFLATSPGRPITKQEIGTSENISPGYIQQLMGRLTSAGLVQSHRGKEGGFSLGLPAEEITVQQVLLATEGPFEISACVGHPEVCTRADTCPANPLWKQVTAAVNDLLDHTTIADLAGPLQAKAESATGSPE